MGRPIWPKRYRPSQAVKFGQREGRPIWRGRAQIIESSSPFTNSFSSRVFVNKFGQKRYENIEKLGLPVDSSIMTPTEVRYPAKDFNDNGFFNGFPFMLEHANYYIKPTENYVETLFKEEVETLGFGFSLRGLTGIQVENHTAQTILGGGYNLLENKGYFAPNDNATSARSITTHHYWNLAAVETDFIIQTRSIPDKYVTGYAKSNLYNSEEGLQHISEDYEVVESYSDQAYLPHLRQYIDPPGSVDYNGDQNNCIIDPDTRLFQGSGQNYSSMFFVGHDTGLYADFFMPLTIQPSNTGAFTITLDQGVAEHLESQEEWGEKKAFNCNIMLDFNTKDRDHEGFVGSNVEYHCFPYKAYIVPAKGWDFSVVGSKVKGFYYTYSQHESARFPGDQSTVINYRPWYKDITFCYSKTEPLRAGGNLLSYNGCDLTHIPFDYQPGGVTLDEEGKLVENTYAYKFNCDNRQSFLTPIIDSSTESQNYKTSFSEAKKYPILGSDLEFYCGAVRAPTVLSNSMIEKFYNRKFDIVNYKKVGKTTIGSQQICRFFMNLQMQNPANNRNLRRLKTELNARIEKPVNSRIIKRKTRDYTQFSDTLNNNASTRKIPLDSSYLGFPSVKDFKS